MFNAISYYALELETFVALWENTVFTNLADIVGIQKLRPHGFRILISMLAILLNIENRVKHRSSTQLCGMLDLCQRDGLPRKVLNMVVLHIAAQVKNRRI